MATRTANVDVVKAMRQMTLNVKLKRNKELKARFWIATRLIALAAWVLNCNVNVETVEGED